MIISDLDIPQPYNSSILHLASKSEDLELLKKIVSKNVLNINLQDSNGWTALHVATYLGHIDMVKFLVEKEKASLNIKTYDEYYNRTPMHIAGENYNVEITKFFIEKGEKFFRPHIGIYGKKNIESYLKELYDYFNNNENEEIVKDVIEAINSFNIEVQKMNANSSNRYYNFQEIDISNNSDDESSSLGDDHSHQD